MTVVVLIRHGAHELQGRVLVGRRSGVHLSQEGRRQAERLADRLGRRPIEAVFSSPLERAQETARPLADRLALNIVLSDEITEIDFGDWTNQPFDALADLRPWQLFNSFRSGTTPPNGEPMLTAQARIVAMIDRLRRQDPNGQVALVSHGDVIKSALAYYLGVPLDLFQRIEVSPGSISTVELTDYGPRVLGVNELADDPQDRM